MTYDLTYILSPLLEKTDGEAVIAKIRDFINVLGGKIKNEQPPQKQKFAYPLKKQLYGYYVGAEFEMDSEKIEELQKQLKLNGDILRYLIISQKEQKLKKEKPKISKGSLAPKPRKLALTPEIPKAKPKVEQVKIEELDKKLEELLKE